MKLFVKPMTDILMLTLFLLLMADRHTGNAVHEWLGLGLVALALLHARWNISWYKTLRKGRYNALRAVRLALNALLLLSLLGALASAVPISQTTFAFVGLQGNLAFRTAHVFFAHWCFILAAAHLGLYGKRLLTELVGPAGASRLMRRERVLFFLAVAFAVYGARAFLRWEMIYPLTLRSSFLPWSENTALFLFDYGSIFFTVAWAVSVISRTRPRLGLLELPLLPQNKP